MRTEVPFTLPRGYVDRAGHVHRDGTMRLATARDEIEPLRDAEVRANEAYLSVLLLARTSASRSGSISSRAMCTATGPCASPRPARST